jgi:hypothetical protein
MTKSPKFDEGRWQVSPLERPYVEIYLQVPQVMFYASGAADADCVGLFLSGEVRRDAWMIWECILSV